jgi:hypothetical protein
MLRGTILLVLLILTQPVRFLASACNSDMWFGTIPLFRFRVNQDHGLAAKMLIEEPGPVGEYFSGFRRIGIQDEADVRHAFKDV